MASGGTPLVEKAGAAWVKGCNSNRNPWILDEQQYRWGVNIVNRGGIVRTRPGYKLLLTLPEGNLQGVELFTADRDKETPVSFLVAAVDGKIYAVPSPFTQPENWETYRLKNLSFNPKAKKIYFVSTRDSIAQTESTISLIDTYSLLIMQDGETNAATWDGITDLHVSQEAPDNSVPIGTHMVFSGQRLWVARGSVLLASDYGDPQIFKERVESVGAGDFIFDSDITGLFSATGDSAKESVLAFTKNNTYTLESWIADRSTWAQAQGGFQRLFLSNLGCIAGDSIVSHAGLVWWFSSHGLVFIDTAAAAYLSSQIKLKDMEMAWSKRNLAPDLSGVAGCSFENYLLMSVPSGDTYNAHTWVLDSGSSDELAAQDPPCWQGVWTGIRPVRWMTGFIGEQKRIFAASVDYVNTGGSFNHLWEAFQPERSDTYDILNADNAIETVEQPIFCEFQSKNYGDGLGMKRFRYAEVFLTDLSGKVTFQVYFGGNKGGFQKVYDNKLVAITKPSQAPGIQAVKSLYETTGYLRPQFRRVRTQDALHLTQEEGDNVEDIYPDSVDRSFCLLLRWCGDAGVDSFRLLMQPEPESAIGFAYKSEDDGKYRCVTEDGRGILL